MARAHRKLSKKAKIIIIVVVVTAIVGTILGLSLYACSKFGVGAFNVHDKTVYATDREYLEFREEFTSPYVWIDEDGTAVWAAFVKDVYLENDEPDASFDITCDTYYWLWVNGEEVVWEGSLKRGITPTDGYYDSVKVDNLFKKGNNRIAVLVRHLGDDGYSHKDSGRGGLLIQGKIGDKDFCTDADWKGKKFAYEYNAFTGFFNNLNFRLSERGSDIRGENYFEFWNPDYPTDDWSNVVVLSQEESKCFGKSFLNPLPLKYADDVVEFEIEQNKTFSKRTTLRFDLGINTQFCPYFEFVSDKDGRKITYYTENRKLNYKNKYTAVKGENEFTDFAWLSGETLIVTFDKGITLKSVGYRRTGYRTDALYDDFSCSDEALNTLWQKSINTLLITMRDTYMDCPDRERAQWIGDAVIESEMSYYSTSPSSAALFKKAILSTYGWTHADGVIQTVVPDGVEAYELPVQNLAFLVGCTDYVRYTGDTSVEPIILSMAKGYLKLWNMEDGLIVHRKGSWDWGDWGSNVDMTVLENAWYYYALTKIEPLATALGEQEFAAFCKDRSASIKTAFARFYSSDGYKSGKKADDRGNAIAVLSGLYDETKSEELAQMLFSKRNSSPYMEKYVEEALCALGRVDLALTRAKERYSDMIGDDYTTLWESWDKNVGTKNHAWSGGTLSVISKYVTGINPTSDGYATYSVKPDFSYLRDFCQTIEPSENKKITVVAARLDDNRQMVVVTTDLDGGQLIIKGQNVVFNNETVAADESGYCVLELQQGENVLEFTIA